MTNLRRRLVAGMLLTAVAIAGCSTPVVTPSPSIDASAPLPTPTPTALAPATDPAPSLAAISPSDIGPGPWTLIATATNAGTSGPEVGVLGGARSDFAYIFTCDGEGTARVTVSASTTAMGNEDPPASPVLAGAATYACPGTEIFTNDTGMFEGGGWFISPDVNASAGVLYQLLVVTSGG